tara:strand:- start:4204 stop:4674 length:471 start_codon:yes stop_codon:yes gene_type:complete
MAKQTISRDVPLAELTLRRYEKPVELGQRDLVKRLCLSLGLLQPGDSRDVVVDVLHVLLDQRKRKRPISSEQIRKKVVDFRKKNEMALLGVAGSNIRRQLKRLRNVMLVEKVTNNYRITEYLGLVDIMDEKLQKLILPMIIERVRDYMGEVDEKFK